MKIIIANNLDIIPSISCSQGTQRNFTVQQRGVYYTVYYWLTLNKHTHTQYTVDVTTAATPAIQRAFYYCIVRNY